MCRQTTWTCHCIGPELRSGHEFIVLKLCFRFVLCALKKKKAGLFSLYLRPINSHGNAASQMSHSWLTRGEVLLPKERQRSVNHVWKCTTTNNKEAQNKCPLVLIHKNPREEGKKRFFQSAEQHPGLFLQLCTDARNGWLMVWKDNVIEFWEHLSPGELLHVCLCDICDTERVSSYKTTDIWDEKNKLKCRTS